QDNLMIINKSGIVIRIGVETLRVMGRATQGVKLIRLNDNDEIASITKVAREDELEEGEEQGEGYVANEEGAATPGSDEGAVSDNNDEESE
ncbi:hypothetical protein M8994_22725, partial [Brucella sp. 21LCYQ03]|nr:hypothetical protein [Brucella sp. 21LCYQ03]